MVYLIEQLAPYVALVFVIGLVLGWYAGSPRRDDR